MPTVTDTTRYGISVSVGAAGGNGINTTWFGDGSDGKIKLTSGNTHTVSVVEDAQTAVINAQSLTLDEGATITTSGRCQGLIIKVQKDCVINGTINMDCKSPLQCENEDELAANPIITLCGSPSGGNGGAGGACITNNFGNISHHGYGGEGGTGHVFGGGYAGGGGGSYAGGSSATRPPVGITWPYPGTGGAGAYGSGGGAGDSHPGGSAPGGGGASGSGSNNGNGYGGGAIYLIVGGNLTIGSSGLLTANGGNGGNSTSSTQTSGGYSASTTSGSGGGGGGGIICIVYRGSIIQGGTLSVAGGEAGTSSVTNCMGQAGSIGTTMVSSLAALMEG